MSANTPEDSQLKIGLVDDVMTVINSEGVYLWFNVVSKVMSRWLEVLTWFTKESQLLYQIRVCTLQCWDVDWIGWKIWGNWLEVVPIDWAKSIWRRRRWGWSRTQRKRKRTLTNFRWGIQNLVLQIRTYPCLWIRICERRSTMWIQNLLGIFLSGKRRRWVPMDPSQETLKIRNSNNNDLSLLSYILLLWFSIPLPQYIAYFVVIITISFYFKTMKVIGFTLLALLITLAVTEDYYSTKLAQKMIQFSAITYES